MPITMERLLAIQNECMADDIEIPREATAWVESEARAFFESGGNELPTIMAGFEGAEIHAFYEISQRRLETTDQGTMMDALSAALFKTTGDEKFKVEEKPKVEDLQEQVVKVEAELVELQIRLQQLMELLILVAVAVVVE